MFIGFCVTLFLWSLFFGVKIKTKNMYGLYDDDISMLKCGVPKTLRFWAIFMYTVYTYIYVYIYKIMHMYIYDYVYVYI